MINFIYNRNKPKLNRIEFEHNMLTTKQALQVDAHAHLAIAVKPQQLKTCNFIEVNESMR